MRIIDKDILDVSYGIIAHQVNCQGVMGAGLALKIARKWPEIKRRYQRCCITNSVFGLGLGEIDWEYAQKSLIIVSLFAQDRYGKDKRYTDYDALAKCLDKLSDLRSVMGKDVYLPYGLGCGLAGGDWDVVSELIEKHCPSAIVCKLPEVGND